MDLFNSIFFSNGGGGGGAIRIPQICKKISLFHLCNYWQEGCVFENTHTAHYWFLWNLQKLAPSTGLSRNHDTIYYHLVGLPHIKQFKCAVKKRPHFRNRHNCESCWTHGAMNSKTGFASYVPKCCSKPQFIMIHTLSVEVWWGEKKVIFVFRELGLRGVKGFRF